MTTQINQLTELTTTSDDDLILIRENSTGIDKRMKAQNIRAKATTKDDVGLGNVDNVSAADLRDRSTHTGSLNNTPVGDTTASTGNFTNLAYTGTLTGGTGVVNLGSGQVVKGASGNVGIGQTNPLTKLQIKTETATNETAIRLSDDVTQTLNVIVDGTATTGGIVYQNPNVGYQSWQTSNQERMRIDSSGNVGIGTTAPSTQPAKMVINGGNAGLTEGNAVELFRVGDGRAAIASDGLRFSAVRDTTTGDSGNWQTQTLRLERNIDNVAPQSGIDFSPEILKLRTGGTERMRIASNGNVGIGTTETNGKIRLVASDADNIIALNISQNRTSSVLPAISIYNAFTSIGTATAAEFLDHNGAVRGTITVTTSATAYNTSSDYRLKENIQPLTGALDKVQAMNPVTYDWKAGGQGEGFIAHELQEIAPYAVSGEKDGKDMQGVDYGKLTTLLVGAVKELTAKVEQLEAQLGANNAN